MEPWRDDPASSTQLTGSIMEGEGRGLGASCLPSRQRPEWGHINRGEKRVYFCVIIKNFYKLLRS